MFISIGNIQLFANIINKHIRKQALYILISVPHQLKLIHKFHLHKTIKSRLKKPNHAFYLHENFCLEKFISTLVDLCRRTT